jgi:hypothetical protein
MISAAGHYAIAMRDTEACYVKHASTFLGATRPFADWIDGPPAGAVSSSGRSLSARDVLERYADRSEPMPWDAADVEPPPQTDNLLEAP